MLSLGDGAAGVVAGAGEEALRKWSEEEGVGDVIAGCWLLALTAGGGLRGERGMGEWRRGCYMAGSFLRPLMIVSNGSCLRARPVTRSLAWKIAAALGFPSAAIPRGYPLATFAFHG